MTTAILYDAIPGLRAIDEQLEAIGMSRDGKLLVLDHACDEARRVPADLYERVLLGLEREVRVARARVKATRSAFFGLVMRQTPEAAAKSSPCRASAAEARRVLIDANRRLREFLEGNVPFHGSHAPLCAAMRHGAQLVATRQRLLSEYRRRQIAVVRGKGSIGFVLNA